MSSDYESVERALSEGVPPALLCDTCPWDRNCLTPPTMTKADVDARLKAATEKDEQLLAAAKARGEAAGMPVGTMLTALTMGSKHLTAVCCPVFVLRLHSSSGRVLADGLKVQMQAWDDEEVQT